MKMPTNHFSASGVSRMFFIIRGYRESPVFVILDNH